MVPISDPTAQMNRMKTGSSVLSGTVLQIGLNVVYIIAQDGTVFVMELKLADVRARTKIQKFVNSGNAMKDTGNVLIIKHASKGNIFVMEIDTVQMLVMKIRPTA